jgi:hypothetical protein
MASIIQGLLDSEAKAYREHPAKPSAKRPAIEYPMTPPPSQHPSEHFGHWGEMETDTPAMTVGGGSAPGGAKLAGNMPPVTILSSGASNITNNESKIFKFKNTYKVFFDNTEDITFGTENAYKWYTPFTTIKPERTITSIPIYDHNGQQYETGLPNNDMNNHCIYAKLPWKLIPTLKQENYVTPNQWNEMLTDGWDCAREVGKRTRISGLYQMHSYEQAAAGEVQNQTNPYVEFCSPVGQFFKHEHYRIDSILGNTVNPTTTTLANAQRDYEAQEDNNMPIVMNAVEAFKANSNDFEALGLNSLYYGIDEIAYDNTLRSYYYPTFSPNTSTTAYEPVASSAYIASASTKANQWYPDITSTQTVHMTDLLDDYVHNVPVDSQLVNLGNYVSYIRPGMIALKSTPTSLLGDNPSYYSTKFIADWTTSAIGHVNYIKSAGPGDIEEWQKDDIYKDTPPLLVRIPNHPNSGNQLINNKCYMYITYEIEIECRKYKKRPITTFARGPLVNTTTLLSNLLDIPIGNGIIEDSSNNLGIGLNSTINVIVGKYKPVYKIYNNNPGKINQFVTLHDQVVEPRAQRRKQRRWNPVVDNCYSKHSLIITDVKRENFGFINRLQESYNKNELLSDNYGYQPKQN